MYIWYIWHLLKKLTIQLTRALNYVLGYLGVCCLTQTVSGKKFYPLKKKTLEVFFCLYIYL